ncbi:DUF2141 domain-containing protein [Rubrivivax sp. RP6-9]|uniref:DUF2141 domain-containing protein n=1 Tax=Rubrivivax sp. RP6-9 TaxID=3415750 RepID=UPI003CC62ED7
MNRTLWPACLLALFTGHAAAATSAEFTVVGARSDQGVLRAMLCAPGERFPNGCKLAQAVPAKAQGSSFVFKDLPNGRYAFAVFHDEDNNGRLGLSSISNSTEAIGFSNNANGPGGVPLFNIAAVDVQGPVKHVVKLRTMRR